MKQESSESIATFIAHAQEALRFLQSTRPPPPRLAPLSPGTAAIVTYSLEDSDRELLISVLLNGTKYSALTTSLLAQSELTVQQVEDALKNEEAHRLGASAAAAAASALYSGPSTAAPGSNSSDCAFCGKPGHTVERCYKFQDYSMQRRRSRRPLITRKRRRKFARAKPMLPRNPLSLQEPPLYVLSPLLAPYLTPGMPTQGPLLI